MPTDPRITSHKSFRWFKCTYYQVMIEKPLIPIPSGSRQAIQTFHESADEWRNMNNRLRSIVWLLNWFQEPPCISFTCMDSFDVPKYLNGRIDILTWIWTLTPTKTMPDFLRSKRTLKQRLAQGFFFFNYYNFPFFLLSDISSACTKECIVNKFSSSKTGMTLCCI